MNELVIGEGTFKSCDVCGASIAAHDHDEAVLDPAWEVSRGGSFDLDHFGFLSVVFSCDLPRNAAGRSNSMPVSGSASHARP
jgi:hypothetical protein